jgi:hypothetical protein
MPNIEIISLRLNLDKAEDRALYETIKSLVDTGNRNEFLKRSLRECLTEDGVRKATAGRAKKQRRDLSEPTVGQVFPEAPGPARPVASSITKTTSYPVSRKSADNSQDQEASEKEAAGLVASFVQ